MRKLLPLLLGAALIVPASACIDWAENGIPLPGVGPTPTPAPILPGEPNGLLPPHIIREATTTSVLHDARLDLAIRQHVDPDSVEFVRAVPGGFDGCLGLALPFQACPAILIGGFAATFRIDETEYRYHFGGDQYAGPVDPATPAGSELPPELMPDFDAILAAYAREDLALRLGLEVKDVTTTAVVPAIFDGCLGFPATETTPCTKIAIYGAIVLLSADGEDYRYHVTTRGIVATDFQEGVLGVQPDPAVVDVQQKMRADLAGRLDVDVATISVRAYREVQWQDGCLGVHYPDALCTQALVDGFLARFSDAGGKEYTYHGGNGTFVAVDFAPGAIIRTPIIFRP